MRINTAKDLLEELQYLEANHPEQLEFPIYIFNPVTHERHYLEDVDVLTDCVDLNMEEESIGES